MLVADSLPAAVYVVSIDLLDGALTSAWMYCAEWRVLSYESDEVVDDTEVRFKMLRGWDTVVENISAGDERDTDSEQIARSKKRRSART